MALAANALVTLAEAKNHLDLDSTSAFDARVERYVNAASDAIESFCQRKFLLQTHIVRRDGRSSDRILLPEWPVLDVASVWDDPSWDFDAGALIDPSEYTLEDAQTLVLRQRRFQRGNQSVKVVFRAGFRDPNGGTEGPVLPAAISYACLIQAEYLRTLRDDRRVGVQSKGKQSENISFTTDGLPPQVSAMLAPYVRYEAPLSDASIGNF